MKICPGCGLKSETLCKELINELSFYTLSLQDTWFIHQLVVDTYAAQHALPSKKPISGSFALIGLYLTFEKGFTGKQVQRAHMVLAKKSKIWPQFIIPTNHWPLTVADVMKSPAGEQRDAMIKKWGEFVWLIWKEKYFKEVEGLVML